MVTPEMRELIGCGNCTEHKCDGVYCLTNVMAKLRDQLKGSEAALAAARQDNDTQRAVIADLRKDRQAALNNEHTAVHALVEEREAWARERTRLVDALNKIAATQEENKQLRLEIEQLLHDASNWLVEKAQDSELTETINECNEKLKNATKSFKQTTPSHKCPTVAFPFSGEVGICVDCGKRWTRTERARYLSSEGVPR